MSVSIHSVSHAGGHTDSVPAQWSDTVGAHRREVRAVTLDAVGALVAELGLASVTMSGIAERAGIGRATLYRHFPDVDAVLLAWHERQVGRHLAQLTEVRDRSGGGTGQLRAVLEAYAGLAREQAGSGLAEALHGAGHVASARQHVRQLLAELIAAGARSGELRGDVAPAELAAYCLHALGAAAGLPSSAAVARLVGVTLDGLRPPPA
jgi:AcrR family transcriptional regulator